MEHKIPHVVEELYLSRPEYNPRFLAELPQKRSCPRTWPVELLSGPAAGPSIG